MERDGARQFYALKGELEHAVREAEAGEFDDFDPEAFDPEAYRWRYGDDHPAIPLGATGP